MAQYTWPPVTASNPSVGTTGAAAPASATEIGGVNSGNLVGVKVGSDGTVFVTGSGGTFPVSGTVTANQGTAGAGAWPVSAAQSGTWNITDVSGTVSLPTGASTLTAQNTGNASLSSIDTSTAAINTKTPALGQALAAASVPVVLTAAQLSTLTPLSSVTVTQATGTNLHTTVDNFPATQPVSGTVAATQSGAWNITNVSGTVSLPTGAATLTAQGTGNTSLSSIDTKTPALGQALAAASVPVVLTAAQISTLTPLTSVTVTQGTGTSLHTVVDSGTVAATQSGTWTVQPGNTPNTTAWLTSDAGFSAVGKATNAYASVNVTTAAYTQLIASTSSATKEIEIFDSSGQSLVLATGAALSEVDQIYIFPGGNGRVKLTIAASTRISIKAVSATASSGNIYLNLYG